MDSFYVISTSPDDTSRVATVVAPFLRLGDAILLTGTLAAGKTHFVKALASALGCSELVTSPTYTIANFYKLESGSLLHIDLYRLSGIAEFRDLGLEEYFPETITVVEWGDMISEEFADYLAIRFDFTGPGYGHRELTFSASGQRWMSELAQLQRKLVSV